MSTEIHEGPVSAVRFFGGRDQGMGIQITSSNGWRCSDDGFGIFTQGAYADVVECARAIVAFDDEEKRAALGAAAPRTEEPK